MARYKVLKAPFWLLWEDDEELEMIQDTLKHHPEIDPVFNRAGHYFDRITKTVWYEAHGRAWKADRIDDFLCELQSLDHRPLVECERAAIQTLINRNRCPRELRDLLYLDDHVQQLRDIKLNCRRMWLGNE